MRHHSKLTKFLGVIVEKKARITPKWLREDAPYTRKVRKSKGHEERLAKELGAKRLPGSGNRPLSSWSAPCETAGGDLKSDSFLYEHKGVEKATQSIGVTRARLQKVCEGAKKAMKIPAMLLTFEDAQGHDSEWVLLPLSVAKSFLVGV